MVVRSPLRYLRTAQFVARRRTRAAWEKFLVAPYVARKSSAEGAGHLHAHFASGPARVAKLASMLSGIPFSFTAHAKDLFWSGHQHGRNNKLKKRVRQARFVVTISDYNRRFIEQQNFRVPRRRLVTIYNGMALREWPFVRPDGRPVTAPPGEPPIVLGVGRLVPKKGFEVLVDACHRLKEEGVSFRCLIAGDGPLRETLEARIREKGLTGHVALVGPIPQDRLRAHFYTTASVLVQPSIVAADGDQDGLPTVIVEALASGLPVVASLVSGIDEAVINGKTGLAARPRDAADLAASITRVLTEPELTEQLARGGRRHVENRFDLENNVKVLKHLMESSALGTVRWSNAKLRERIGLEPAEELTPDAAVDDVPV